MENQNISDLLELSSNILKSLQETDCDFELLLELDAQRLQKLTLLFENSAGSEWQSQLEQLQELSSLDKQIVAALSQKRQSLIKEVAIQRSSQKVKKAYR